MGAEIWRIILDIDDLEEWGDASMMVMVGGDDDDDDYDDEEEEVPGW
jgi:hypothetical protein